MPGGRLAQLELPASRREQVLTLNSVLDEVSKNLRNTRAVCRQCYVHPRVVEAWQEGRLNAEIGQLRRRLPRPLKGLDVGESILLRWLEAEVRRD